MLVVLCFVVFGCADVYYLFRACLLVGLSVRVLFCFALLCLDVF